MQTLPIDLTKNDVEVECKLSENWNFILLSFFKIAI